MKRIIYKTHREDKRGNVFTVQYIYRADWDDRAFYIPRGFESDGASVPRFFWRLVFPKTDSNAATAGICHDWIYREQPADWTRKEADKLFQSFLVMFGISVWRSVLAYIALRLFGWRAWNENASVKATREAAEELKAEKKT